MMTETTITIEIFTAEMQETLHHPANNIKLGHRHMVGTTTDLDPILAHQEGHPSEDRDACPMADIDLAVITEEHKVENLNHHQDPLNHVAHKQRRL